MQSTKNETNIQKQIQNPDILYVVRLGLPSSCPLLCDRSSVEVGGVPAPTPRSWCGVHAARCEPASFDAAPSKVSISWQTRLTVKAKLVFGGSRELSQEDYENTRNLHCVENPTKRYKKTVGTYITSVRPLVKEPPYQDKQFSSWYVRFKPAAV